MPRVLGIVAAALVAGGMAGVATPVSASDLEIVAPPPRIEAPPPAVGYDYRLHRGFSKLVPVRAAPSTFSPIIFAVPSGIIPALTGRCTRSLSLASIAEESVWYRRAMVVTRWCEVAGLNGTGAGWINGDYIRPF